ncbi:STAS domain-containing protein [Amycolatopsis thailandensis]|uniref:STAS domain-containing protein n=1 Tax=Amycolatopsis thailandensis TaxID=589330 RepID=UPI001177D0CA|nr:hypothetical protein [Amycolatopsis thailandensis]
MAHTVVVRGNGDVDAAGAVTFAVALEKAAASGALTVLVDLTGAGLFCLEAAKALVAHARGSNGYRLMLNPSPAVRRKLSLLGLTGLIRQTGSGAV